MCVYRYGVVLRKQDLLKEAVDVFVEAIHALPLHWGAWLELSNLVTNIEMVITFVFSNQAVDSAVNINRNLNGLIASRLMIALLSWSRCLYQTAGLKTFSWPTCTLNCRWSKKLCRNTKASLRLAFLRAPTSSHRLLWPTTTSEVCFFYPFHYEFCLPEECDRCNLMAVSHFILDIDQALALFNELRDQDPYRIDNMDTFSNLLYVKVRFVFKGV